MLFIFALIFLAYCHTKVLFENRRLKYRHTDYYHCPTKQIFIGEKESPYISKLIKMSCEAHEQAQDLIAITKMNDDNSIREMIYQSGDAISYYTYGMSIKPLAKYEIENYEIILFLDHKLPQGAERAIIEALGLRNYIIRIGICDES